MAHEGTNPRGGVKKNNCPITAGFLKLRGGKMPGRGPLGGRTRINFGKAKAILKNSGQEEKVDANYLSPSREIIH